MKIFHPSRSLRLLAGFAISAATCLVFAGCFGVGGGRGEAGLVVSSVDPAVAANAGRTDMALAEPTADYSSPGGDEYSERDAEGEPETSEGREPVGRTEITPATREYKVVKGDSLSKISGMFDTSIAAIKSANGMSGDKLVAGQMLRIPDRKGSEGVGEKPADGDGSSEVVATLPKKGGEKPITEPSAEKAEEEIPETLPSGVVPPDPPRRPSLNVGEDETGAEDEGSPTSTETTIGDDGFLRFGDE